MHPTTDQETASSQRLCAIVHGPAGSGKTLHAPSICSAFGLRLLVDSWDDTQPLRPGALHLTRHTRQSTRPGLMVLDIDSALYMCQHLGLVKLEGPRFGIVNPAAWSALRASVTAHSSTATAIQYAEDWAAKAEELLRAGLSKQAAFEQAEADAYPSRSPHAGPHLRQFACATLQRHWVFGGELATWNAMRRALTPQPAVDTRRAEA